MTEEDFDRLQGQVHALHAAMDASLWHSQPKARRSRIQYSNSQKAVGHVSRTVCRQDPAGLFSCKSLTAASSVTWQSAITRLTRTSDIDRAAAESGHGGEGCGDDAHHEAIGRDRDKLGSLHENTVGTG